MGSKSFSHITVCHQRHCHSYVTQQYSTYYIMRFTFMHDPFYPPYPHTDNVPPV